MHSCVIYYTFKNQQNLKGEGIEKYAKEKNVYECYTSQATKEKVRKIIAAADPFNIRSTPTMIINGKKIDRSVPLKYLYAIIDTLLARGK